MKEKLEFLLKNKSLTATTFARLLDVQPSSISHIMSGRNKPSYDFVVKILRAFPDINPDWLLLGSEQIFREEQAQLSPTPTTGSEPTPHEPVLHFDESENIESSESMSQQKNDSMPSFSLPNSCSKRIERVIVLYSDHSFESYTSL